MWAKRAQGPGSTAGQGEIRVLCIHGVGHGDVDPALREEWGASLRRSFLRANPTVRLNVEYLSYDDLFDQAPHTVLTYAEALLRLGGSMASSMWDELRGRRRGMTGASGCAETLRWTVGMVAQWAESAQLRQATRQRLAEAMQGFQPDVVVAHSLGSLISFDTFSRVRDEEGRAWDGPGLVRGRFYVTLGSQIGSRCTRSLLGGRIEPLHARHWFHLYNPHDDAFTSELRLSVSNFDQLTTPFDVSGVLDHDAVGYLRHAAALEGCWRSIALAEPEPQPVEGRGRGVNRAVAGGMDAEVRTAREGAMRASVLRPRVRVAPRRRALLVGINDYPNPADRLEGCVNDVFLMSSLLQESGFGAEDIRVVLNDRATAKGILERLEWLLDGAQDGCERVFYYSGHGAQIPGYGLGETVDRKDECLVAYDFDWSLEHAVTDDQFHELYSQLPYGARFCAVLDCCHSGGMTREGGQRVRGLTPPDDVRHRVLRWSEAEQMWVERDLSAGNAERRKQIVERRKHAGIFGVGGDESRLFRASAMRSGDKAFETAREAHGHHGPYLPVILQACREQEYSYEYRHGVTSYGAFTYSLAHYVREHRKLAKPVSWQKMVSDLGSRLKRLGYDQKPGLVCPQRLKKEVVPWGELKS